MTGMPFSNPMILALKNTKPNVWPAEPIDQSKPWKWQARQLIKCPAKNMQKQGMECIQHREPGGKWYKGYVWSMRTKSGVWGDYTNEGFLKFARYRPGQEYYCKETWWHHKSTEIEQAGFVGGTITLLDDGPAKYHPNPDFDPSRYPHVWKKKSPRFMPGWAARMAVKVMGVRAERLQDITNLDILAEGVTPLDYSNPDDPLDEFRGRYEMAYIALWESLHGPGTWKANPWVFRYELMRTR